MPAFFPRPSAPVLKRLREANTPTKAEKPVAVVELPATLMGRFRGLFSLDRPKKGAPR